MTSPDNNVGAGVLEILDYLADHARGAEEARYARKARATIESAMALPREWLAVAATLSAADNEVADAAADALRKCAQEHEAIFGPAPPATDAPEECGAIGSRGHAYAPEGPNGEMQCRYCGAELPSRPNSPTTFTPSAGGGDLPEPVAGSVSRGTDGSVLADNRRYTADQMRAYGEQCRLASGGGANNYGNASERDSQTDHRTAQCAQDTAEKMASRAGSGDSVRSGESPDIATQHALDIGAMVNRFLAWRLPDDFGPDAGISFTPNPQFPHAWPTGTNLLTAVQARAMFEHCAGGARVGQEAEVEARWLNAAGRILGVTSGLYRLLCAEAESLRRKGAAPTPENRE